MSDDDIKRLYIEWRSNPANVQCQDIAFLSSYSQQGITASRLHAVLKQHPEIEHEINSRPLTEEEVLTKFELMIRQSFNKAFLEKIPVKSYEGLLNMIINALKHRQLQQGKPTEILRVKYEELRKKTPEELQRHLLGLIRHGRDN